MLQGSVRSPDWFHQAAYSTTRLPAPQPYSSYSIYDQPTGHVAQHNTMHDDPAHSNVLSSAAHQPAPSQLSSNWPNRYSDTPSTYTHATYPRHDESGIASAPPQPNPTSRVGSTSRTARVGPRKTLTDDDRREICLYHRQHPDKKQTEIGGMLFHF